MSGRKRSSHTPATEWSATIAVSTIDTDDTFDPLVDEKPSRYVVGVDLGTTNSAATYVDTEESPDTIYTLAIPQLVAVGEVEKRDTLPSFHYEPASGEAETGGFKLPWKQLTDYAVGVYAREQGALAPGRLIASAKSWLCHAGVDRQADILPWRAAADVKRMSPVEASSRYLAHIRSAWDAQFPNHPLGEQDLVLTLPASFDEVARELTIEAAAKAGLKRVVLIEEPQAAFYAWVHRNAADWETLVQPGQKILICDIGGGTSDFTLIRVRKSRESTAGADKVQFHRVAVGEHLILGGDNLDITLAHFVESKIGKDKLSPKQWDMLIRACRRVKEEMLGVGSPDSTTIHLPGSGGKLIGGGVTTEVTREEVRQTLLEGFFPQCDLNEKPKKEASGFREFGLPYASDAAITRYLADFLTTHAATGLDEDELAAASPGEQSARPDIVLFNGGLLESPIIGQRLVETITSWFADSNATGDWAPTVLVANELHLAVAQGAAYYGMVRRGQGVKIVANLARSYYVEIAGEQPQAVCLVHGSAEPGDDVAITNRQFDLLVSQPVEFQILVSSTRLADQPGDVLDVDPQNMRPLPPIRTVLKSRQKKDESIAVELHSRLTEIGVVNMWCAEVQGDRRWRLQFDVRPATQTDLEEVEQTTVGGVFDESLWNPAQQLMQATFGESAEEKPERLIKSIEKKIELRRGDWSPVLLRRMWDELFEMREGRRHSAKHEARWLNFLGYSLRPGYGMAVDDWRVAETWRAVHNKLANNAPTCRTESLILWRRISGGLSAGQQNAVAEPLLNPVRSLHRRFTTGKAKGGEMTLAPHESNEVWRLLGSLELLPAATKIEIGDMVVDLVGKKKMEPARPAMLWTLGRVGQRAPMYGPLNTVVSNQHVGRWVSAVLEMKTTESMSHFAVMQMSRKTGDRHRDLPADLRGQIADWLEDTGAKPHYRDLVLQGGTLAGEEQDEVFGERLPRGLKLRS